MTKEEFNIRWEYDDLGDGLIWEDVKNCYIEWKLDSTFETKPKSYILYMVLKAANTTDAENYKPKEE